MRKLQLFTAVAIMAMVSLSANAQRQLTVQANKPGAVIQPTMYGIFFEDINFGADGGLYAEMVQNRSFEFPTRLMGWNAFGNVQVSDQRPAFDRNPHYVVLGDSGHIEKALRLLRLCPTARQWQRTRTHPRGTGERQQQHHHHPAHHHQQQ